MSEYIIDLKSYFIVHIHVKDCSVVMKLDIAIQLHWAPLAQDYFIAHILWCQIVQISFYDGLGRARKYLNLRAGFQLIYKLVDQQIPAVLEQFLT